MGRCRKEFTRVSTDDELSALAGSTFGIHPSGTLTVSSKATVRNRNIHRPVFVWAVGMATLGDMAASKNGRSYLAVMDDDRGGCQPIKVDRKV
jgi:hypothetical protein